MDDVIVTSNTASKAKREFEILKKTTQDAVVLEFEEEILRLVDAFGNSGQSGGSASFTASIIKNVVYKLCMQEPIGAITGEDWEWMEVGQGDYQNTRCSAVFKNGKEGKPYYLDAIRWIDQKGHGWHSNNVKSADGKNYCSRQTIKSFPFTPKTFDIKIEDVEVAKDDWEFYLRDITQLTEVFEYYGEYFNE